VAKYFARQMRHKGRKVSAEKVIRRMSKEGGVIEQVLKAGGHWRNMSELRMEISMLEIDRNLGVGISAIVVGIKKKESNERD